MQKYIHGVVQCEHAVLHNMVEASSSKSIPVSEEPAEHSEGEIGVDSASHSISTSCSDASKFVAKRGDMGEGACGGRVQMLFRGEAFHMAWSAPVHCVVWPVKTQVAGA